MAAVVAAIALLAIFAIVGSMDYADETRELAYWAERGVTVHRW